MTTYTATYSPDDNKLRLYATSRLDAELYARVKAAGFRWAPKQEIFFATWNLAAEDIAKELAGEIEDEDKTLTERAEERADRFVDYSGKRATEAERARESVEAIAGNIPFGQPILVGHHSERRARKDAEKIENGMRKAVKLWETSEYWKDRAAGALHHAKYKELPAVRARRIKTIEAEKRSYERTQADNKKCLAFWSQENITQEQAITFANYHGFTMARKEGDRPDFNQSPRAYTCLTNDSPTLYAPRTLQEVIDAARRIYPRSIERHQRIINHLENRLTYEKAMLDEQGASDLIAKKPRPKQLPLLNYKQESFTLPHRWTKGQTETLQQVELTSEQYSAINADSRGTREVDGTHRIRVAPISFNDDGSISRWPSYKAKWCAIYLTDSKTHPKPAPATKEEKHPEEKLAEIWAEKGVSQEMQAQIMADIEAKAKPEYLASIFPAKTEDKPQETAKPQKMQQADMFEAMRETLKAGVKTVSAPQLFPTPAPLAERVIEEAQIGEGMRVLEPSAGTGALLAPLYNAEGTSWILGDKGQLVAVEINHNLAHNLSTQYVNADVRNTDFLQCNGDLGTFDRIIMNPPFTGQADIDHVTHALKFLKEGGRLVAIMSAGVMFRQDKKAQAFRAMVEQKGGVIEELPAGSFTQSGTNVNTVLVTV